MFTVVATTEVREIEAVCRILHAAFSAHDGRIDPPSGALRETPDRIASRLGEETLLVARDQSGEVAGCIFYRQLSKTEAYIGRLAVDPARQGGGIARALLLAAVDRAKASAVTTVGLGVRVELAENIAFFERHGFKITRADSHAGYDRPTNYRMELQL